MPVAAEGHRARMRQRAERMSTEAMRSQDIVELLLYYALPRRDTRQQAYDLMERFGSLQKLFSADVELISAVKGIGVRSAQWLRAVGELVDAYGQLNADDRPCINNIGRAGAFLESFFAEMDYSEVWQFCLNAGGRLLGGALISECAAWGESEYLRAALAGAMRARSHSVIIGQFSPHMRDEMDEYDEEHTLAYALTLSAAGIQLLDHVIICADGVYSMFGSGRLERVRRLMRDNQLRENYLMEETGFDGNIYD